MGLSITKKTIDKYFGFLINLDTSSKKRLIVRLTESIDLKSDKDFNLRSLYGAWEDSRDSDEIIAEIRNSRIDKSNLPDF